MNIVTWACEFFGKALTLNSLLLCPEMQLETDWPNDSGNVFCDSTKNGHWVPTAKNEKHLPHCCQRKMQNQHVQWSGRTSVPTVGVTFLVWFDYRVWRWSVFIENLLVYFWKSFLETGLVTFYPEAKILFVTSCKWSDCATGGKQFSQSWLHLFKAINHILWRLVWQSCADI